MIPLLRPLVFLDIETTGTSTDTDRIVELAMRRFEPNGEPKALYRLVNPGMVIPKEARDIHGIDNDKVATCPLFAGIAKEVFDFVADADFAGFGIARFDLPILRRELLEAGKPIELLGRKVVDVKTIYHKQHPRDLTSAVRLYCDKELEGAHGATVDMEASIDVLIAQMHAHEDLPNTIEGLHDYCGGDEGIALDCAGKFVMKQGKPTFTFGKHVGRSIDEVANMDRSFLEWMLGKDFAADTKQMCRDALAGKWRARR